MFREVCDPGKIKKLSVLEEILDQMDLYLIAYGMTDKNEVGVGLLQNNQFGASYKIVTKQQYKESKGNVEEYTLFYPYSYFKDLRGKLKR